MKKLFYLLFCFSLSGCGDSDPQKPRNLIRQDKLVQILADIHTVEAQVERAILYPDTALMTFNHYQQQVLEKHKVTDQDFRKTYNYFLQHPEEMDEIYEIVIDTLNMREIKVSRTGLADLAQIDGENTNIQVAGPGAATPAAENITDEEWLQVWQCKLLFYQQYPLAGSTAALRFYLAPNFHNLPASCINHYLDTTVQPQNVPTLPPPPTENQTVN